MKRLKYFALAASLLFSSVATPQQRFVAIGSKLLFTTTGGGGAGLVSIPEPPSDEFVNTYSLLLDGVAEYINIDAVRTSLAATTVGTFSFWVKPVDATPTSNEFLLGFSDASQNEGMRLWISTTGLLRMNCRTVAEVKWDLDTDAAAFSNNTWTYVAVVQPNDGNGIILYVNGVKPNQTFITSTALNVWFSGLSNLDVGQLGASNQNGSGYINHFNGNFDEVLFINRALTQPQIADIYNLGAPKDESAIANGIAGYRMGDDAGDNFNIDTANEWDFADIILSNACFTINCEVGDRVADVPN